MGGTKNRIDEVLREALVNSATPDDPLENAKAELRNVMSRRSEKACRAVAGAATVYGLIWDEPGIEDGSFARIAMGCTKKQLVELLSWMLQGYHEMGQAAIMHVDAHADVMDDLRQEKQEREREQRRDSKARGEMREEIADLQGSNGALSNKVSELAKECARKDSALETFGNAARSAAASLETAIELAGARQLGGTEKAPGGFVTHVKKFPEDRRAGRYVDEWRVTVEPSEWHD